jgi:putative restriction endonuclease
MDDRPIRSDRAESVETASCANTDFHAIGAHSLGGSSLNSSEGDHAIRVAAFHEIYRLQRTHLLLSGANLRAGFRFQNEKISFVNPMRGIFKPKQMHTLLSIRTVFPKPGARVWYDDQREVHKQVFEGEESVDYSFMGTDPEAPDNRWLRDAMVKQVPIVYFLGVSPGRYQAFLPAFIVDWDQKRAKCKVVFGDVESGPYAEPPPSPLERRYALRTVKQRLHQATFREAVIGAYKGRCALSGLPEALLLDAAHIVDDGDNQFGQPVVPNGVPLSKIHHAAFDAHLIGIDPDFRIHVSKRLLSQEDGAMLEALKQLNQKKLLLPHRERDYPDQARLESRFKVFKASS